MKIYKLLEIIEYNILGKADIYLKYHKLSLKEKIKKRLGMDVRLLWINPITGSDCADVINSWSFDLYRKYKKQLDKILADRKKEGRWTTRLTFSKKETEAVIEFIERHLL